MRQVLAQPEGGERRRNIEVCASIVTFGRTVFSPGPGLASGSARSTGKRERVGKSCRLREKGLREGRLWRPERGDVLLFRVAFLAKYEKADGIGLEVEGDDRAFIPQGDVPFFSGDGEDGLLRYLLGLLRGGRPGAAHSLPF